MAIGGVVSDGVWGNHSAERYCGGICVRECDDGEEDVLGVETLRGSGLGDTGVFADTTTEGMDGSCECECVELELAMLNVSQASMAFAVSVSLS